MSSLLTEILISLVVIAVIGGIIGWLVRGVQVSHRENRLDLDLLKAREEVEESLGKVQKLEASMKKMNQLRKTEREQLERRIKELEPLFDIVEKRDNRIRELTGKLDSIQAEHQSDLDNLRFDLSTQALLDDDNGEVENLKQELQVATRQRESAISRYQNQLRQIEDLENVVKEKERLGAELQSRLDAAEKSGRSGLDELQRELSEARRRLSEKEEELALLSNKKQYQHGLIEARARKAEEELADFRSRLGEAEAISRAAQVRENEQSRQVAELRAELAERKLELAELQRERDSRPPPARPAPIRAVPVAESRAESNGASNLPGPDDDLQSLKGIGRATANKLKRAGIQTLGQMAALDEEDIERISVEMPDFRNKNERFEWVASARQLIGASDAPGTASAKRG